MLFDGTVSCAGATLKLTPNFGNSEIFRPLLGQAFIVSKRASSRFQQQGPSRGRIYYKNFREISLPLSRHIINDDRGPGNAASHRPD